MRCGGGLEAQGGLQSMFMRIVGEWNRAIKEDYVDVGEQRAGKWVFHVGRSFS